MITPNGINFLPGTEIAIFSEKEIVGAFSNHKYFTNTSFLHGSVTIIYFAFANDQLRVFLTHKNTRYIYSVYFLPRKREGKGENLYAIPEISEHIGSPPYTIPEIRKLVGSPPYTFPDSRNPVGSPPYKVPDSRKLIGSKAKSMKIEKNKPK